MSNFKKFLSLVLATVMVAGMMVFTAPSAAAYAPTGDYADNIALLNAFDVMLGDGVSFGEKENVTRWQMALFIARIVTGETGNDMWEADESEFFTDVKADHYPGAIDFCAEMGYIKGVGDNKFDPEGNIIYQDALTMLVRLLGYETASTSYPWGYILTARKIMIGTTDTLTSEINTGNKTPLLREEVANLLAKAIYVPVLDAKGNPTVALVESGLNAENIGDGTLVATWNGAIADYATPTVDDKGTDDTADDETVLVYPAYPAYGSVVFKVGSALHTVKIANVTKNTELDFNELLGFKASLVDVKGTKLANMNNVSVHDTFKVEADKNVQIDGVKITNILQYAPKEEAANNNLFVASKANLSTKGRVIVCDVKNDGITKDDIARFIPFETTKAVYTADNITVAKSKSWPADMKLTLYYVATNGRYEAALYNSTKKNTDDALLISIIDEDKALGGLNLGSTDVSNSKGDAKARTNLDGYAYKESTSLFVHVNGDLKPGEIFLGNIKTVGGHTFITVADAVEIATGTATLNGIEDSKSVKLGDTSFPVGYNKTIAGVNTWYFEYADAAADIGALMGTKINYITANGAVIDIAKYTEKTEAETFNSPYNKDSLITVLKTDGKEMTVNADNTITIKTYDPSSMSYKNVLIDQIDGVKVAQLINQLGVDMTANILGLSDIEKADDIVEALLAKSAYAFVGGKYAFSLVAVANKAGDVYSVSTKAADLAKLKRAVLGTVAGQDKADDNATVNLTFTKYGDNALSNSKFNLGKFDTAKNAWDFTGTYLSVNKSTNYVIVGSNGLVHYSDFVPAAGNSITFTESDDTIALAMSNDLVVIYSASAKTTDIVNFTTGSSAPVASNKGDWYTLTWKSDYVDMSVETIDKVPYYTYNFKELRNLTTGKNETVSIVSTTYFANPATDIFGAKWLSGNSNSTAIDSSNIVATAYKYINVSGKEVEDKKGTLYDDKWGSNNGNSNFYSVWFITEDGAISESSIYSWGLANGYEVGVITGITQPSSSTAADQHNLVIVNKKLTATATGYTVSAGDATKDTDIVVTYSMKVSNVSNGATGDELMKDVAYNNTTGYQNKAKSELVLYKLSENGEAIVIANFADAFNKNSTEIADSQAK